ncbi:glycosyltransferase [Clostridium brassicae]|uniref:Glycosyltransferase n=1 Tax=Clostridium brassicae TaxID=2999072 RepID=A0ABT4D8J4_9CLOT|nr:glycosyltransferase [Clostridium brassicae]MCY6958615.1 glycosyltransferase [Clostridium brassicae]
MKVLHIITGNDNGGGAKHVLNICKYSIDCENILGCIGEGYLYSKSLEESVNTIMFPNKISNKEIINFVEENKIDIMNFHGAKAFLIHRFLKNKIKAATLASIHSDYRYDFLNNKIKYLLFTPLSKYGLKSFENYMCISNYIKDVLDENGFKGDKAVINNGINAEEIKVTVTKEEIRKTYEISEKDFVFVSVGRLHPIKNHQSLIKSFSKLRNEFKDTKLVIVGDGALREELKELIKKLDLENDVVLTGFVENPINIVNACDISILTSFNEGGSPPIVILESGLVKKSIISTKVGDIEKNFDENTVFIIDKNTEEEIYNKMKEVYLNKDKIDCMGEELYKEVIKNYNMKRFCNTYYSFYKKILGC